MASKTFYLTVAGTKQGQYVKLGTPRCTQAKPGLANNEISIAITLNLPDELFSKPSLSATIEISEDQVAPATISAEVIDNIEKVARAEGIVLEINQAKETE